MHLAVSGLPILHVRLQPRRKRCTDHSPTSAYCIWRRCCGQRFSRKMAAAQGRGVRTVYSRNWYTLGTGPVGGTAVFNTSIAPKYPVQEILSDNVPVFHCCPTETKFTIQNILSFQFGAVGWRLNRNLLHRSSILAFQNELDWNLRSVSADGLFPVHHFLPAKVLMHICHRAVLRYRKKGILIL